MVAAQRSEKSTDARARKRAKRRVKPAAVRAAGKIIDEGVKRLRAKGRGYIPGRYTVVGELTQEHETLQELIELERERLLRALSLLHCLHLTLLTAEEHNRYEFGCAQVADMVFGLVKGTVERLDSVHVDPLIEQIRQSS